MRSAERHAHLGVGKVSGLNFGLVSHATEENIDRSNASFSSVKRGSVQCIHSFIPVTVISVTFRKFALKNSSRPA